MSIKCEAKQFSVKTYNPDFDVVTIIFTDQNGRSLEREDKVNLTLLIIK